MCNHDDDLKCVPCYKPKLTWYDHIVIGLVLSILVIGLGLLIYGVFNPIYLMC